MSATSARSFDARRLASEDLKIRAEEEKKKSSVLREKGFLKLCCRRPSSHFYTEGINQYIFMHPIMNTSYRFVFRKLRKKARRSKSLNDLRLRCLDNQNASRLLKVKAAARGATSSAHIYVHVAGHVRVHCGSVFFPLCVVPLTEFMCTSATPSRLSLSPLLSLLSGFALHLVDATHVLCLTIFLFMFNQKKENFGSSFSTARTKVAHRYNEN